MTAVAMSRNIPAANWQQLETRRAAARH